MSTEKYIIAALVTVFMLLLLTAVGVHIYDTQIELEHRKLDIQCLNTAGANHDR